MSESLQPTKCRSCGDRIKPWTCPNCQMLVSGRYGSRHIVRRRISDQCRECHDETVHNVVDGRQLVRNKR